MTDLLYKKIPDEGIEHELLKYLANSLIKYMLVEEIAEQVSFPGIELKTFVQSLQGQVAINSAYFWRNKYDPDIVSLDNLINYFEEKEGLLTELRIAHESDTVNFLNEIESIRTLEKFESIIINSFFKTLNDNEKLYKEYDILQNLEDENKANSLIK
tara:strand:+ start:228 stop:698 length:471 start_codon:yes stop_codon:yes gene_type:complete